MNTSESSSNQAKNIFEKISEFKWEGLPDGEAFEGGKARDNIGFEFTPKRDCLNKNALRQRSLTFRQWIKEENHMYISVNAKKYLGDEKAEESKWVNPFETAYKKGEIDLATCLEYYECYVRTELWDKLPELAHRRIGCWCKLESRCHGDVLINLFKEYHDLTARTNNGERPQQLTKDAAYGRNREFYR